MLRGTNLPSVGAYNQTVVFELIRRAEQGISRAELAVSSGLSAQTVSNTAARLIDGGLIVEAGTHIQGRGKPPVMLCLEPRSRFAVGVNLDAAFVSYVLLDLAGNVVASAHRRTPSLDDPDTVVVEMVAEIDALVASASVDRSLILGIGVVSPGPIDGERGIVLGHPLLKGWHNVPLRDAIAERTGLEVVFASAVNAAAVAELWIGEPGRRDFALVYMATGIGTGLVVGGNVIFGPTGNAGDGGTTVVPDSGVPNAKSQMVGHLVMAEFLVQQAVDEGVLSPGGDVDVQFDALLSAATAGVGGALRIFQRAGRNLGSMIATLVNLLDITEIVFGGAYWERIAPLVLPSVTYVAQTSDLRSTHNEIKISTSTIGAEVPAVGAACLVLDTVLSPRTSSMLL